MSVLDLINTTQKNQKKILGILIDPDTDVIKIKSILHNLPNSGVEMILVGGSLIYQGKFEETIALIKNYSKLPVVIFPGSEMQISENADALLFLSLISGRNPDLLIGKHVISAPYLMKMNLEVIPTAYMLIDSGKPTTASYVSQTMPIPTDKPGIALATAQAGELLGLKLIYMDAGSGALTPISAEMIQTVKAHTTLPIIIGGGIKSKEGIQKAWNAGADVVIVGNILEENPETLNKF
jgi:phosphoglycerol geranylgeranyltransferase